MYVKVRHFFLPIVAWRIIRNLYFEVRSVYVGNKRTENLTTNYVSLIGYYFQDSFARKNSSSGFFITDYAYRDGSTFAI